MKKTLLISAALMLANVAFSQGTVVFANRSAGAVVAPIYQQDAADATHRIVGNTSTGFPVGNTSYGSAGFLFDDGVHTWTAQLWGKLSTQFTGSQTSDANNLDFLGANGAATFRTATSGTFAGIINPPSGNPQLAGVGQNDIDARGMFQMRVWDTKGGTITTWAQLIQPQNAGVLRGYSDVFLLNAQLGGTFPASGGTPALAPFLGGLTSFNVFVVPEPSVIALGVLGAGCLFLLRRRK